ncbi:hypothetical protein PSTEL_02150 [Paenibacillus stellifer]|uniref:5-bromo-4-chloroindolyl phosphate hydrolysis protein n=1 Tax=Paenibacillus stellifer TaxID=169760 RepID=A0A089LKN0_9BACL|nr:hypothetical protein [Paenibacillus stellifer]AIQ62101.1 hypothetical protein PSTEL_02150 [Paenibacillus stellifer]
MKSQAKVLVYAGIGYAAAVLTSSILPEMLSLLLPVGGAALGLMGGGSRRSNLPAEVLPAGQETAASLPSRQGAGGAGGSGGLPGASGRPGAPGGAAGSRGQAAAPQASASGFQAAHPAEEPGSGAPGRSGGGINPEFLPVVEYLGILEDMIISEGQKYTLDNEIVEKSLALFARLQRVIPQLQELNSGEINHTIRRLVLKDLNAVINPFLRLSGEAKTRNRRMLLNGIKDIDSKITEIASTIEHKDLMELQSKAELIHQRYNSAEL